jgi:hypothetical protein
MTLVYNLIKVTLGIMTAKYVQPLSECIQFHENVDNTVNLITSTIHHLCSHYTGQMTFIPRTRTSSFEGTDTAALCLIKQYTMKGDEGQNIEFHTFLTLSGPTSSYL